MWRERGIPGAAGSFFLFDALFAYSGARVCNFSAGRLNGARSE